ncbi:MAG: carbamoyl-phosphate synthase large subunit [Kiritimatiellia bacterium]
MGKRKDLSKIMIIGAGPIVIGQACEFDYSGAQACKSLREEGYEVVLVNSNPATIMTDPDFADRTYIEPLTVDILHKIIRRERPDAILPTLGGQTALNLAMELHAQGILERYHIELIGANAEVIHRAEDRQAFKEAMLRVGLEVPRSGTAHTLGEAQAVRDQIGSWPVIIRPAFTLGGAGGGIAHNPEEFAAIVGNGLALSPVSEVLIEESVLGWKEFEMEVMRDKKDNCCIICSIENLDPMGVHTGDSITVAPAQTLTDREYQRMRDASIAVMRVIGVETGGSNVQFAINPKDGRLVVIEMNPRVSRSSALASKATGFPIARIAAKLAVGYTLDEIRNDITRQTPACFEPSIDYVVTKVPRFAFEKFIGTNPTLTTQMKSVGETMAIGTTFQQSFQKALRSLEIGRAGFGADGKIDFSGDDYALEAAIATPTPQRIFQVREALARGWSVARINQLTQIDPWFLEQMRQLVKQAESIASCGSLEAFARNPEQLACAKAKGFSDRQIAYLLHTDEDAVRQLRYGKGIEPVYGLVDTCAAEFKAFTPYFYSRWGACDESSTLPEPKSKGKVMILGGGPNRIGQGIEFDYCCVHACYALHEAGYETIMVNSNPETVSTDYDTSDRLYFEPLTLEDVLTIYRREQCQGMIVQFGGQTPLNLAMSLKRNGVRILGTSPESIEQAEDREFFKELAERVGVRQPANGTAMTYDEALEVAHRIGFPVLVRPSFVLGGRAMAIAYDEASFEPFAREAFAASEGHPVLIDKFLSNAIEVDVDCISDGEIQLLGAIMEHVEKAGIHSGDSACMIPPNSLSEGICEQIRQYTYALARELHVVGLMNVQYAVQDGVVYIIEVNPRASRTIPFVSKVTGIPFAKVAARVMAGEKLREIGLVREPVLPYHAVKEAVIPFHRFPGCDVLLTPEMHSTGEVMGIDLDLGMAYVKSQLGAGNTIPESGSIFLSAATEKDGVVACAKELAAMGFKLYATRGTATALWNAGLSPGAVYRIESGRPNILDLMAQHAVQWIVNLPSGSSAHRDEIRMRSEAVRRGIPMTTTLRGLQAAVDGLKTLRLMKSPEVLSLQEFHKHIRNACRLRAAR